MSKKRVSGAWVDDTPHIYNTSTDTFSTLPHEVIGDGTAISSYTIKGNMAQSGTPTPSNPVYPTEVGEKTANLYTEIIYDANIDGGGKPIVLSGFDLYVAPVEQGKTYIHNGTLFAYYTTKPKLGTLSADGTRHFDDQFTVPTGVTWVAVRYNDTATNAMIAQGTSMPSYEPMGYKIPISLNGVEYPIYITEPLRKSLDGSNLYDTIESNGTLTRRVDANGDALATPTTEQVTVPTLTTTGTAEQFNVLTTLAPSEISLTYHGWHEHEDTKFTT